MKTRKLLLSILSLVMALILFGGCYTMISQNVYTRPEVQFPQRSANIEQPAPVRDINSAQEDSLTADSDQQEIGLQRDLAQNGDDQYGYPPNGFNGPYGMPGPYGYDGWQNPPGMYGSYMGDPYMYTPRLRFGLLFNSGDPFYWHDPWFYGYNSWNDPFYCDPFYSPYYSMFDPWYGSYFGSYYYGGGYDYYHRYYGRGGGYGNHDGIALAPRKIRQDRLAGFGAYANTRGSYAADNSVSGSTRGAVQVNRRATGEGLGISITRRNASSDVIGKTTAGTVASPDIGITGQVNPPVRRMTRPGEMTRRVNDSQTYVVTVPNDGTGSPVVQYRDPPEQSTDPKDIKISREDKPVQTSQPAVTQNRRQGQNTAQRRSGGETEATQSNNNAPDPAPSTERAVTRPAPAQNDTPSERVDTSRSNTPSRDTGRSATSSTSTNRGNSTPSYTPRSGGGSSSGGESRNTSSRSGSRRR